MIINDKSSLPSKRTLFKTSLDQSSLTTVDTNLTKIKKRKIIILGKMGVGKSSILKRFVDNAMPDKPQMTYEENYSKNFLFKNEEVKMHMIDTAGQSEFTPALPNRYCIGVHAYILAFSIDNNHSFEVIQHVNRILLDGIGTKYIPRILVGNKKDLESHREVSEERIKKLAKSMKCPYIECSALEGGAEIDKIFYKLLKEVDKEINDEYPYDIKNSTIKMNYIRKHHKTFNFIFLIAMGLLISFGLFFFIYTIYLMASASMFFNTYLILNLIFSITLSFNCFRAMRVMRKQIYQGINSVNLGMYITMAMNIVLFIIIFFKSVIGESLWTYLESFNLTVIYLLTIFLQIGGVIINQSLEPLYKEFYSTTSMNQQLLIKI